MKYYVVLLLLILSFSSKAQSPYKFSWAVDAPVVSVGVGGMLTGFILEKKRQPLNMQQIMALDRNNVSLFDRSATYNWNPKIAKASDALMYTSLATPLFLLVGERSRKDFLKVAAISAEVFVLNTGLTYLTKELTKRKRPYTYNPNAPMDKKLDKGATQSFFSGHTSTVSSAMFSFAMMHTHYYPNSKWKPLVWFAAAVIPFTTAIFRVRAGKHFWTDVMVGYGVGAAVGVGVPLLHKIRNK